MPTPTLLLVDAYALIYRAFYAIRSLNSPTGEPVNAIFGFTKMLRKMLGNPAVTHCAVVFDLGAPRRRLEILASYKEQRPPTPPDLAAQVPVIQEVLQAMRVPAVAIDGEEADDVIATLATQAATAGLDVLIASSDKDFAQIVTAQIRLLRPEGKETVCLDAGAVETRYGVRPDQIVDYLCLLGDSVDNIRGVPGVGEKTAVQLLRQFGHLEELLNRAGEIEKPKLRDALQSAGDLLRTNRSLIALHCDLALPVTWSDLGRQEPANEALLQLYRQLGFRSLAAELAPGPKPELDLFGQPAD